LLVALSVAAVCGPSDMHPEPTFPFLSAMPAESDSTGSAPCWKAHTQCGKAGQVRRRGGKNPLSAGTLEPQGAGPAIPLQAHFTDVA
jgi:hypothetical protein